MNDRIRRVKILRTSETRDRVSSSVDILFNDKPIGVGAVRVTKERAFLAVMRKVAETTREASTQAIIALSRPLKTSQNQEG
jgi:hypothetical protein